MIINIPYNKKVLEVIGNENFQQKSDVEIITSLIKNNSKITRNEIANKLGVSKATIARHLKNMQDIEYVGFSKSGHWEIVD